MRAKLKRWIELFFYQNDPLLLNNRFRKSQDAFIMQVLFGNAFGVLSGGVFLSGLMLYMGLSDTLVGLVGLLPGISGIMMVFVGLFWERIEHRKKWVIGFHAVSKTLLVSIALIPAIVPAAVRAPVVIVVLFLAYIMQNMNGISINVWYMDVVPIEIRGRYTALRQVFALIMSVVLPVVSGAFLDWMTSLDLRYAGFLIIYGIAATMIVGEAVAYARIEEIPHPPSGVKVRLIDVVRMPLSNKPFMRFTAIIFLIHIFLYISCTYTSVYMLKYLQMPYMLVTGFSTFNALLQLFLSRWWGRVVDRLGAKFVMKACMWCWVFELTIWALMPKGWYWLLIPSNMISAACGAGFGMATFNYRYSILPTANRSFYDGFYSAMVGIALMVSPLLGNVLRNAVAVSPLFAKIQFAEFRVMYGLSVVLLLVLNILYSGMWNPEKWRQLYRIIKSSWIGFRRRAR